MKSKKILSKFSLKNFIIVISIVLYIIYELIFLTLNLNIKVSIVYGLLIPLVVLGGWILIIFQLSYTFKDAEKIELSQIKGTGGKNDPFIIDTDSDFSRFSEIKNSQNYYKIQNCEVDSLVLNKRSNITIESCKFISLDLISCLNINIIKSSMESELCLLECRKANITSCFINKLSLSFSYNNLIKDCQIKIIQNEFSYNNIFEKNRIHKDELLKLTRLYSKEEKRFKTILKENIRYILLFSICLFSALLFASYYYTNPISIIILTLIILSIMFLLIFILYAPDIILRLKLSKKVKEISKYPNNVIIE